MNHVQLPPQFAFLEPFVDDWGSLATQDERYRKRQDLSQAKLEAFHAALAPRLEEVFTYLDTFDPAALPAAEALLFRVVLGLTEASQAVEILGQPRIPHAPYPHTVNMEWVGYQPH
ncbi:MAG: hypothetical protein Q8R81_17815 [Novosphingobium sp.]|uniref:hypothetical protein n=1 Tax=Novosphingobium sp. TaxID=1874826 RepID=UPI0027330437|nr:hypothetical protein [Novosphingobium sp.]MDP3552244.1 hypothetical protein [Novosphingobium sp.]